MLAPEIMTQGKLGGIIQGIQDAKCEINAMQMFDTTQLDELQRSMGKEDAPKVIKKISAKGNSLLLEVSHPKGYNVLLEEMLKIEGDNHTGFTHFDKGDEKLSEKIFY